ncbi:competence protein [Oceanobacillus piezotolerans]|uniref:Competence protein n=1 Tax=Oceanobacillus piezotolerans TaxID=2448030 RepID=A0A498D801_9BACI|nr:competence protein ComK [Oceanobacillus piezotolerans]RLL43918.1 competence protein [Oceanobacillus piezotolerans]
MKQTILDYSINPQTAALIPIMHQDYKTIIIEKDKQLFINQTPIDLIKKACLVYLSTYEGRRKAVMHQMNYKRKIPIPINPSLHIISFPTHSTSHSNCCWIFYKHVKEIEKHPLKNQSDSSIITFSNDTQLLIDVSPYILRKQYKRAEMCLELFLSNSQDICLNMEGLLIS